MNKKVKSFKRVCAVCHKLQKGGKSIVFCHGFFDILHRGHVELLVRAKKLGDVLVIGVDHDDNARILKGPKRPINDHTSRMFVLANLEPVDFVFLIDPFKDISFTKAPLSNFYLKKYYAKLKPDVVASCIRKDNGGGLLKEKQAEEIGAKFVNIQRGYYEKDTTKIIELLGLD